ncbi:hypothetical protein A6U92_23720 [Agrobacterium rubi]|uniref:Uncharacterized protein n=1 Tax=Agrobacterium tumefaciens TaxID=358 RepID=A0A5B9T241_AGRTU|nr:hypothetical protein A6U92_23720 [Agrobacterium rubi]QEG97977.1 hypothetical protein AgrTiT37_00014 [Agrobacterium tumefaciens]
MMGGDVFRKNSLLLDEDNVFISLLDDIGNTKNNRDPKHTLIDYATLLGVVDGNYAERWHDPKAMIG